MRRRHSPNHLYNQKLGSHKSTTTRFGLANVCGPSRYEMHYCALAAELTRRAACELAWQASSPESGSARTLFGCSPKERERERENSIEKVIHSWASAPFRGQPGALRWHPSYHRRLVGTRSSWEDRKALADFTGAK